MYSNVASVSIWFSFYVDGERCGKTIVDIFQKAKDPDKIVIGVIDQSSEEDTFCLEAYCKEMGFDIFRRMPIRKDTTKVIVKPDRGECPRVDQIRKVSVHHIAAKGPTWARSLSRKVLGNEEFCMQIDSHTEFVQGWDEISKREWAATGNEFGIISTVPTAFADKEKDIHSLPRQCEVQFLEVGIPVSISYRLILSKWDYFPYV